MNRVLGVIVLSLALVLSGCATQSQLVPRSEPTPTSTPAPTPTVRPANPERSYRTGQIVGEALSNAWIDLKEFGKGAWSELNNNEGNENDQPDP